MIRVKVPNVIRLGIYKYRIKFDHAMLITNGNVGEHRPSTGVIALDPHMSAPSQTQCLNHEVLHHICNQYKLGLGEDDIDRLATGWAEYMERGLGIQYDWSGIRGEK